MELYVKGFEPVWKAMGDGAGVSQEELRLINALALEPLAAEQVYTRRMRLCNDQFDRSRERFPRDYLERFRATLPGKSLLGNHQHGEFALGRFYKAELEEEEGVTYLVPSFYMLRLAENEETRRQIDAGVWNHVSIGFVFDKLFCDLCGKEYYDWRTPDPCRHLRGRSYDGRECTLTYGGDLTRVEAVEASIVYLGCQYGSQLVKGTRERGSEGVREREGEKEEWMERIDGAGERGSGNEGVSERGSEGVSEAAVGSLPLSLTPSLTLSPTEAEALRTLAADGELYRADLRGEIRRVAGVCGAGKEAGMVLDVLRDAPAARLKELLAEYQTRAEKLFPPTGQGTPLSVPSASPRDTRAPGSHSVV
jgi:hypothetical protein